MRKKEKKLVITFDTTADAMAMEQLCKDQAAPGRLIPVPGSIAAGCGLAWCAEPACTKRLKDIMQNAGITEQAIHECMI